MYFISNVLFYLVNGLPRVEYNSFLIFTTSGTGMFVVLQDLTGQGISQNYLDNLKASIGEFIK